MTELHVCHAPTLYQPLLPQCPIPEFGPSKQLLLMQLLQQLRDSQLHNECLNLIHELHEEQDRSDPSNRRLTLELQCLLQIHLKLQLRKLEERRKHLEEKLQKLEEKNTLEMEEADERIDKFIVYLMAMGIDITETDPFPVLHWAAAFGTPHLVSKLISAGASTHIRDHRQDTPLISAARKGQSQIVKLLIELGSNVNARNKNGLTALHGAAIAGCVETTTALIENGNGTEIDSKTRIGRTPLHRAAYHGHLSIIQLLVKHGADINYRDEDGNNPLMAAAMGRKSDVVCWLVQNVKNIDTEPNEEHLTQLHVAVTVGSLQMVQCLLENGFPVNTPGDIFPPVILATEKDDLEMIQLLLKFGAEVNRKSKNGITPLHIAAHEGNLKIARVLVEHDADLLAVDRDGNTAESISRRRKHRHIEEFLKNTRRTKDLG